MKTFSPSTRMPRHPFIFLFLLSACTMRMPHTPSQIEMEMNHYDSLLKKMDADSIAHLYAPDGQLGTVARGRDSIRRFLSGFNNVRVLEIGSSNKTIDIKGDTAFHTGTYFQTALLNGKDTAHLKGSFTAEWIWLKNEGWKIRKMTTKPE